MSDDFSRRCLLAVDIFGTQIYFSISRSGPHPTDCFHFDQEIFFVAQVIDILNLEIECHNLNLFCLI